MRTTTAGLCLSLLVLFMIVAGIVGGICKNSTSASTQATMAPVQDTLVVIERSGTVHRFPISATEDRWDPVGSYRYESNHGWVRVYVRTPIPSNGNIFNSTLKAILEIPRENVAKVEVLPHR
jgi:hypothetical protein